MVISTFWDLFVIVQSHVAWGNLILPSRSSTFFHFHPATVMPSAVSLHFMSYSLERFQHKTCNLGFKAYWPLPIHFPVQTKVDKFWSRDLLLSQNWSREQLWSSSGTVPCFSLCTSSASLAQWEAFLMLPKEWYFGKAKGVLSVVIREHMAISCSMIKTRNKIKCCSKHRIFHVGEMLLFLNSYLMPKSNFRVWGKYVKKVNLTLVWAVLIAPS